MNKFYPAIVVATLLLGSGCEPVRQSGTGLATDTTPDSGPVVLRESRPLAGTTFTIEVITLDTPTARRAIEAAFAEVARLENVVSEWTASSEISHINATSGQTSITLSPELFGVINRALWFAGQTGGAFDPSFAGCAQVWSIPERRIPSTLELANCRHTVGYESILLDTRYSTIKLDKPGMRIGLGGIGKGYRVDRAAEILEDHGITSYVVNGGGDIRLAADEHAEPWRVEIDHPRAPGQRLGSISLRRGAIATSGDSSWYFDDAGIRYHHIFDPRTGQPARQSIAVTVIAERAIDADALATGLFVLGPEQGLALLGSMPGFEALLVSPDHSVYSTPGFPEISDRASGDT